MNKIVYQVKILHLLILSMVSANVFSASVRTEDLSNYINSENISIYIGTIKHKIDEYTIISQSPDECVEFQLGYDALEKKGDLNRRMFVDEFCEKINTFLLSRLPVKCHQNAHAQEWRLRVLFPRLDFYNLEKDLRHCKVRSYTIQNIKKEYVHPGEDQTDLDARRNIWKLLNAKLILPNNIKPFESFLIIDKNDVSADILYGSDLTESCQCTSVFRLHTTVDMLVDEYRIQHVDTWVQKIPDTEIRYITFPNIPFYNELLREILLTGINNDRVIIDLRGRCLGEVDDIRYLLKGLFKQDKYVGTLFCLEDIENFFNSSENRSLVLDELMISDFLEYLDTVSKKGIFIESKDLCRFNLDDKKPNIVLLTDECTCALAEILVYCLKMNMPKSKIFQIGASTGGNPNTSIEYDPCNIIGPLYLQVPKNNILLSNRTFLLNHPLEPDKQCNPDCSNDYRSDIAIQLGVNWLKDNQNYEDTQEAVNGICDKRWWGFLGY